MRDPNALKADKEKLEQSSYFDPEWYLQTYKDVSVLGMDPAEHYLKYGALMRRDPGPNFSTGFYLDTTPGAWQKTVNPVLHHLKHQGDNADLAPEPRFVLWAAFNLTRSHGHDVGIAMAQKYLPEEYKHTVGLLEATKHIKQGHETDWLKRLNDYLQNFRVAPIELKPEGDTLLSRMTTAKLPGINSGPVITVIMPAWNAQDTILYTARSILRQTWRPLELIIVDDASTDDTWQVMQKVAKSDKRVKILRNSVNVGPYVSKNIALTHATGEFVTGHDADDWALPQRLENHMREAYFGERNLDASLCHMVRMHPNGVFGHIGKITSFSFDGVARKASISCLFRKSILDKKLGFWDSVRFGADSELIGRTVSVLGERFDVLKQVSMICLDLETSLTNHAVHGVNKVSGISPIRANYRDAWVQWHKTELPKGNTFLDFPLAKRKFDAALEMTVPVTDALANLTTEKGT
ncbi:glycosyltransferase family 2 protein [Sulfitobacter sp. F26169L]|uniref:glycosyltransferase family 2 protein n=1 Tax=Sulfitobacter sp. F26169L TaxID=2996015 RepID=UPI002260E528|nr:glycosyltransferase family 2 protein [Sulfitobacter sp. F26169L]MCX7568337.1 glycosyltransferase family 2 protein [Sulfitobacter sp. F26169L]